ncbi:hypothetical protein TNCV_229031 [Trichonephila clavipes]|nr:hypothetical protein TNCV_229031 [Trichonephila clavipes]
MIASFVKENHDNWDRFFQEFSLAQRTSVNETTRSNSGKSRRSIKPSDNENKSCKSNKENAGLEDLRVKPTRPVVSTGTSESLTGPERPGQTVAKDTVQLRGDQSGVERNEQCETLPVLPKEPLQGARRTTRRAEEYWDRQSTTKQPQVMEPQHGSLRRRSDR